MPGPRGLQALRFLGIDSPGGLLAFFAECARTYGPITGFRALGTRVVLLDDAELIGEVLQHQQHRFSRDTGAVLLRELVGESVLTTEDPKHLQRRRLLQPAFHRERIAGYTAHMVEEAEHAATGWQTRKTIDVGVEMTRLTLAVVGRALFGTTVGDEAERVAGVIASIAARGGRLQSVAAVLAPLLFALRQRLPASARFVFARERAILEAVVDPIVARKRAAPGGDDLLATMLELRDDAGGVLTDTDIRNELITFVLAGHETTSSALTWCWYLLARHPTAEAALHDELDTVLGGRLPVLDDVSRLRYTAAVFDEALRLYPPAAAFGRRPLQDVTLGGYRVAKNASVFVSPYVTHRNPRYFSDPHAFRPERWTHEPPPKFAFFPFGGGSKMCIGEPFARAEGVLVLATLARRFRLRLADEAAVEPGPSALLRPSRPIIARIERRAVEAAPSGPP